MPGNDTLERMYLDIQDLKAEIRRLSAQKPPYQILNYNVPAALVADQNNYDIGDFAFLFLQAAAPRTITGFAGGITMRQLRVFNLGAAAITLAHQSASSLAANRFYIPGGSNLVMQPYSGTGVGSAVELIYYGSWIPITRFVP